MSGWLAERFPQWEILAEDDGWHAIPSARLAFHGLLHGEPALELHGGTVARLLIALEALKQRTSWTPPAPPHLGSL